VKTSPGKPKSMKTMGRSKTYEIVTTKISMVKVGDDGKTRNGAIVGFEYSPPSLGDAYVIYMSDGRVLRTSPILDVKEVHDSLMLKTRNSIYRLCYVGR